MTGPRWLDPDERETWLGLAAVLELLPAALDAQLHRDEDLTNFEYYVLAMLSEADDRTLRMSRLAAHTNATLPRLSRVVAGLERAGYVERSTCDDDRRATNARLTDAGLAKVVQAAPGHVENVRRHVFDALTPEQVAELGRIADAMLQTLDPEGQMRAGARLASGGSGAPGPAGAAAPMPPLAAPAARAFAAAGLDRLASFAGRSERALLELHGVGRTAIARIDAALAAAGLDPLVRDAPAR